jgi:RpiB/LacA/LacB family sugar-phosphate isomerase
VRVALASDHAGFMLKGSLRAYMMNKGYDILDLGCLSEAPVDYPDFAKLVADAVISKTCYRGIVLCGSGVGATVAANKVKGIRASVCHDTYSAHQGVEHDDMNILVLGARIIGESLAFEIVDAFLSARFSNEERHVRRLQKILALENS